MTSRQSRTGLFLALFALLAQLGWNMRVPDLAALELAALLNDPGAICHVAGDNNGQHGPASPGDDCAMCPCCLGTVLPVALPDPPPPLPLPTRTATIAPVATPPSTGPPPARFTLARPRGPPAQA
jgi:hypothetical protein